VESIHRNEEKMGLDMYLEARKYVSRYDYKSDTEIPVPEYLKIAEMFPAGADEHGSFAGATVEITVGYWRKANAIHNWFVQQCADGVDECQPIRLRDGKLRELRATVDFLLDNKDEDNIHKHIEKLLPPTAGFFFGSTEVDEYYWADLSRTKVILDKAVALEEDNGCSITYQASW
jgi:hypothetical protein